MKRKLVFWTAFNSYQSSKLLRGLPEGSIHPVKTMKWTKRRARLWQKYTLSSILNQTYEDFLYIVLLDPALKDMTRRVLPHRPDKRIIYVYKDRPHLMRLQEYDEIVMALIDADDMYSKDAGKIMMQCKSKWMYFKKGYALNIKNNKFYEYDTIGTGPFWARRINPKELKRFDRDKRHPTHKAVIKQNPEELPAGNFCVLLHDINTSSRPNMRYVIKKRADISVLKRRFGL